MSKDSSKSNTTLTEREVFNHFVFDGKKYSPECIEQAVRQVQRQLGSDELNRVNDALLSRLDRAKTTHRKSSKKELLDDPDISTLVNTLTLVNQGWIATVIFDNIRARKHLRGFTVEDLHSTALTGGGAVGGITNAILQYDYKKSGVVAFTPYLSRAITNSLLPTPKQKKTYKRVESRMRPIRKRDEDGPEPGWVDRTAPRPETAAINHELVELVKSIIPGLPTQQQRDTAAWMIERILDTGELPMHRECAQMQRPRVSVERGRQIMAATVNNIRRLIEATYPQLAEQSINGWDEFKQAFDRTGSSARPAGQGQCRAERDI